MTRFKLIETGIKLLPVHLSRQLLPGTFEHALSCLIDHELDLRVLNERFRNDQSGAPAMCCAGPTPIELPQRPKARPDPKFILTPSSLQVALTPSCTKLQVAQVASCSRSYRDLKNIPDSTAVFAPQP